MPEYELLAVSIISGIFGLAGLMMINHNWFKRQEIKFRYQLKRAKLSQKMKTKVKEEPSLTGTIGNLLPILKNLDSDQIGSLVEWVTDRGYEVEEGTGIESLLGNVPPELIKGFLEGLSKKGKGDGFTSQDGL